MHVAVGVNGNGAYVGDRVGTVVMDMIEAKKMMMADTADCMFSDNVMLLLEIVATSLHQ